jgi:hypothetical protein
VCLANPFCGRGPVGVLSIPVLGVLVFIRGSSLVLPNGDFPRLSRLRLDLGVLESDLFLLLLTGIQLRKGLADLGVSSVVSFGSLVVGVPRVGSLDMRILVG